MAKTKFNSNAFINDLLKKGWIMDGDKITPPSKSYVKPKQKKSKRTYDDQDHLNIKNRDQFHPFKTLIKKECDLDLWPEFQFCAERRFRIDFACPYLKIAIEIDGGIWMRGRSGHSSGTGIKRDQEKTTLLSRYGWSVLRFEPEESMTFKAIDIIKKTIEIKNSQY